MQQVKKSILEDEEIKQLLEMKTKMLNNMTPKYLINKETNTVTALITDIEKAIIDKIDFLVSQRAEKIKKQYA